MFKRLLVLALAFLATPSLAQVSNRDAARDQFVNLLGNYNPGFENGLQRWTKAGSSTLTQNTTTSNLAYGAGSAAWTPGANLDTLTSTQVTVPAALFGTQCIAGAWVKASDGVTTFQVINGSSSVQGSVVLANVATFTYYQVNFVCPASGTLAVQLKASGAGAVVYLDQVYLGGALQAQVIANGTNLMTVPAATDTFVGRATTDALTNKDYQGGTASNSSRVTVPKASQSTLTGLTRKQGTLVYNTDTNRLMADDGTSLNPVHDITIKNYLRSQSNQSALWYTSASTSVAIADDVTAADLPRAQTTKSGLKVTAANNTNHDYVYTNFILDPADYNTKLKLEFVQSCGLAGGATSSCAASDFAVEVHSCTTSWTVAANTAAVCASAGTDTQLPLSTDSSALSALPALTGTYRTTFDAPGSSAVAILIKIKQNANSQTHSITLSDLYVGPGQVVQGAAVGPRTAYVPSATQGFGTLGATDLWYTRVGEGLILEGWFTTGTIAASEAQLGLPSGLTVGTLTSTHPLGTWQQNSATGGDFKTGSVIATQGNAYVQFSNNDKATAQSPFTAQNGNQMFNSSAKVELVNVYIPIAQWAGSGAVNIAQNDISYYCFSGGTWGTTNTALTIVQGQAGCTGGNTTPAGTNFQWLGTPAAPVPVGASAELQLSLDQKSWSPIGYFPNTGTLTGAIETLRNDGTNYIGVQAFVDNTTGKIGLSAGKYAYGTTGAWNNTWYYRIAVGLPGQAVGYGQAAADGQLLGLYKAGAQPGYTGGNTIGPGNVGEKITWASAPTDASISSATIADWTNASIPLTAGIWLVQANVSVSCTANTTIGNSSAATFQITDSSNSIVQNMDKTYAGQSVSAGATQTTQGSLSFSFVTNVSSSTTYKLRYKFTGAGGNCNVYNSTNQHSEFFGLRIH